MAINQLSSSNTFQHWLIATQQLITFANNITDATSNTEFVINNSVIITGSLNVENEIITNNLFATNITANNNLTSNNITTNNIIAINLNSTNFESNSVSTNVLSSDISTLNVVTINVATIEIETVNISSINLAYVGTANIDYADIGLITFSDNTTLSSNSFISTLSGAINAGFDKANSANVLAQAGFDKANSANVLAQAAFNKANTAANISADNNITSTTLYPVMVGAAGVVCTPNVTTSRFTFDASIGRTQIQGFMRSWGTAAGYGVGDRTSATQTDRYTLYSQDNKFHIYDNTGAANKITISGDSIGIGSTKTSPSANLDWTETIVVTSGSVSAVASRTYILTGSTTITLPAGPNVGDWVKICNRGTTLTSTVARNGNPIMQLSEDMTIDKANVPFTLVYTNPTHGWVIV